MDFETIYQLWQYYTDMADEYDHWDTVSDEKYNKYCQFRSLADAMRKNLERKA